MVGVNILLLAGKDFFDVHIKNVESSKYTTFLFSVWVIIEKWCWVVESYIRCMSMDPEGEWRYKNTLDHLKPFISSTYPYMGWVLIIQVIILSVLFQMHIKSPPTSVNQIVWWFWNNESDGGDRNHGVPAGNFPRWIGHFRRRRAHESEQKRGRFAHKNSGTSGECEEERSTRKRREAFADWPLHQPDTPICAISKTVGEYKLRLLYQFWLWQRRRVRIHECHVPLPDWDGPREAGTVASESSTEGQCAVSWKVIRRNRAISGGKVQGSRGHVDIGEAERIIGAGGVEPVEGEVPGRGCLGDDVAVEVLSGKPGSIIAMDWKWGIW